NLFGGLGLGRRRSFHVWQASLIHRVLECAPRRLQCSARSPAPRIPSRWWRPSVRERCRPRVERFEGALVRRDGAAGAMPCLALADLHLVREVHLTPWRDTPVSAGPARREARTNARV